MNAQPLNEKPAGGAALTVEGLTRRFGPHVVLDNVSFTVASGQVVALIGPNGAGKSTLLRCVVGADRADGGQVRFGGRPIDESDPWVRAAVAAALDDADFFPDLSVTEHLELLAFAHGAPVSVAGREIVLLSGVVAAVYRAATRPPIDYSAPVVETPLGLVPLGLVLQLAPRAGRPGAASSSFRYC